MDILSITSYLGYILNFVTLKAPVIIIKAALNIIFLKTNSVPSLT